MGIEGIEHLVDAPECNCVGHRMPGVHHIVPCCDKPHITQEEYNDQHKRS